MPAIATRLFQTLRAQFLLVVAVALLPLVGYSLWRAGVTAAEERQESLRQVAALAKTIAGRQREMVESRRALLVGMAESAALRDFDPAQCTKYLANVARAVASDSIIGYINLEGRAVCTSMPREADVDLSDRLYFRKARENDDFAVGEYVMGRVSKRASIHFALPVRGPDGVQRGILYSGMDLDRLQEYFGASMLPEGASALLIDRNGTILARAPHMAQAVGHRISDEQFGGLFRALGRTSITVRGFDGVERIFSSSEVPGPAEGLLFVAVGLPTQTINARSWSELVWSLVAVFLAALAALGTAWWAGDRFLLRRIHLLTTTARRLAQGERASRTGLQARDGEIGQIGEAIDELASALQREGEAGLLAVAQLHEKSDLLESILENLVEAIVVVDAAGRVVLRNEAGRMALGGGDMELPATEWSETYGFYRPDGSALLAYHELPIARALRGEDVRDVQILVRPPEGGEESLISVTARPLRNHEGAITGALAVRRSLTHERRLEREREAALAGKSRAEEDFRTLFDASAVPTLIYDAESYAILEANREAQSLYGLDMVALRTRSLPGLRVHPALGGLPGGAPALETGHRLDWLERHRVRDGREADLHCVGRGIRYAGRLAVVVSATDVTQRLEAERNLTRAQEALLESQRVANIGTWEYDVQEGTLYLSDAIREGLGFESRRGSERRHGFLQALTGNELARMIDGIHEDDRDRHRRAFERALAGLEDFDIEYRQLSPTRGLCWVRSRARAERDAEGRPMQLRGVLQDVTDRHDAGDRLKQSEVLYRGLFLDNPLPLWIYDRDTLGFLEVNAAALAKYGYSRDEFAALKIDAIRPREEAERVRERAAKPIEGVKMYSDGHHTLKSGHVIDVEALVRDFEFEGRAARLVCPIDVTERNRARASVTRLEAELEALAYAVSHDLRSPLQAIDGFSKVVDESYGERLDEQGRQFLARTRAGAQRMAKLLEALLALSRVGRAKCEPAHVDISREAEAIVRKLRAAEPERVVEITLEPRLSAKADPMLLRELLTQLLGNAWKFTSQTDDARLELCSRRDGAETIYCIRDNGVGFDMRYAGKLFGAFQRLHKDTEFPGVGVGLATVQRIVHRHGGRVWAEAAPQGGAAFYFTLPG